MKQAILSITMLLVLTSCEIECESFDFSREEAKWHMFPDRQTEYFFESDSLSKTLTQVYIDVSEFETKQCAQNCNCRRHFISVYEDESNRFESIATYEPDEGYQRLGVLYSAGYIDFKFKATSNEDITGMDEDSIPFNAYIEYEKLDTLTMGNNLYQNILHIIIPIEEGPSDLWIARGAGLIAFQEKSTLYMKK